MASNLARVLFFGNPLWDCLGRVTHDVLETYNLNPNDAILRENAEIIATMEASEDAQMSYLAGGSAQNTARACAWALDEMLSDVARPLEVCTFTGCVGDDETAVNMCMSCEQAGVKTQYQVCTDGTSTGTCAVLINEKNRSLVANLAAASKFQDSELADELLEQFDIFYFEGFFTGASEATIRRVAEYSRANNKKFIINVSAPFVPHVYRQMFVDIYDKIDYLFANEAEISAFAEALDVSFTDLPELALGLANRGRPTDIEAGQSQFPLTVVVTQGSEATIVAKTGDEAPLLVPIMQLESELIVDTNGAGDSYVGGFLAGLILDRTVNECARLGAVTAHHVIQQIGATYIQPSLDERAVFDLLAGLLHEVASTVADSEDLEAEQLLVDTIFTFDKTI